MSENTDGMKKMRAYNRLLVAILDKKPKMIIDRFVFEYIDCPESAFQLQENMKTALEEARKDAENYFSHSQGGRTTIIRKDSPLGRKLSKGAFSPANEEN